MRRALTRLVIVAAATLAFPALAVAQQPGRVYAGGLAGWHHESADWVRGGSWMGGVLAGVALTPSFGIEVDVSRPGGTFVHEHEGTSVSFAPPGSSRDEIERLAVYSRFTHERTVSSTLTAGAYYGKPVHRRWTPRVFIGVSNRRVEDHGTTTPLRIPAGLTAQQRASVQPSEERVTRNLGALSFGGDVAFALTRRLSLQPSLRYDYGSIGDEINNSFRSSLRVMWWF